MATISVVSLLAYDYKYLFKSLPSYYDIADEIILGLDCDRLSWTQKPFQIDMAAVGAYIEQVDHQKKVRIVEGNFHTTANPALNDTMERSALSCECKPGNWVVQIDADEILLNAAEFKAWLDANNPVDYNVIFRLLVVFKQFGNQVLLIQPPGELMPVATMLRGQFTEGRRTAQMGTVSPLLAVHYSWGRTAEEMYMKLKNWGHAYDFDVEAFFRLWQGVDLTNYQDLKNFHPLTPATWESLQLTVLDLPGIGAA